MIEIDVPGGPSLRLEHLVLDYNGTIACNGELLPEAKSRIDQLAKKVQVHVLTADTFGTAGEKLAELPCKLAVLPQKRQDAGKLQSPGPDIETECAPDRAGGAIPAGQSVWIPAVERFQSLAWLVVAESIHIAAHESRDFESGRALGLTLPALLAEQSRQSMLCTEFEVALFFRSQPQILHDR